LIWTVWNSLIRIMRTQRYSGVRVIRSALSMCRRVATAFAVVAVLAFVVDNALGGNHLVPAASAHAGHTHGHAHSQAPAAASDHQFISGDVAADTEIAAHHHGSSPASGPDADANGCTCACACCAAIVLPSLTTQAAPFLLIRDMAFAYRHHGDGIVPEGLRRPPRPLSIA
jgi:hypothetical protein